MSYPTIEILPNAAAGTATVSDFKTMYHSDPYGTFDLHFGQLSATANAEWEFDHFEWELKYVTTREDQTQKIETYQYTSTSNPYKSTYYRWNSNSEYPPYNTIKGTDTYTSILLYGSWDYDHMSVSPYYHYLPCIISITYIKAIFKSAHVGTGKILYYPSNNKIIYGSRGTILYDD